MMSTDTVEQSSAHDEHTGKDASTVYLPAELPEKVFYGFREKGDDCLLSLWGSRRRIERVFLCFMIPL